MRDHLFVGGPWDGRTCAVDHKRGWYEVLVPIISPPNAPPKGLLWRKEDHYKEVRYRLQIIAGEKERHEVMVLEGLSGDEVIRMLIQHYKPGVRDESIARSENR